MKKTLSAGADNRIWELDALRGFLILMVILDHLAWDVGWSGVHFATPAGIWLQRVSLEYLNSAIRAATHDGFVVLFVVLSGVCSNFSGSNFRRGLRLAAFALGVTVVSVAAEQILHARGAAIYFGILHCLAACQLIFAALERFRCPRGVTLLIGGVSLLIGAYFASEPISVSGFDWRYPFVYNTTFRTATGDFWPLLPYLGWFLIGAVIGGLVYRDRRSVADGRVRPALRWLEFMGRHSIWFYLGSQVIFLGLAYLLALVGF